MPFSDSLLDLAIEVECWVLESEDEFVEGFGREQSVDGDIGIIVNEELHDGEQFFLWAIIHF